jgi:hypothetical protein
MLGASGSMCNAGSMYNTRNGVRMGMCIAGSRYNTMSLDRILLSLVGPKTSNDCQIVLP